MCGLAGILLLPVERSEEEWTAIRQCFTQTLLANEERGREAAGIAIIRQDRSWQLLKQPVPASEFVTSEAYHSLLTQVDMRTTCLLGHTRAATKGDRRDNANNHPIVAGKVVGVHNGHILNDDDLFAQFGFPRAGQVDSEVIFRLLSIVPPSGSNKAYLASVQKYARLLQGRFTTLSVNLDRPNQLLVLKNKMPLCLHYHEPWQALCFSSRYLFLRKAFGRAVITEELPTESAYLFDAERLSELSEKSLGQVPRISLKVGFEATRVSSSI